MTDPTTFAAETASEPGTDSFDRQKLHRVRQKLRAESRRFREAHPFLDKHQSAIGLGLLLASLGVMIGAGALYYLGSIPAWACVVVVAMALSIAHELEHDNIHFCYFRNHKWVQNLMMGIGWAMRPSTINPWIRRRIHLDHHRVSGTEEDVEERGITNGDPWGPMRLAMIGDSFLTVMMHARGRGFAAWAKRVAYVSIAFLPMSLAYYGILLTFVGSHAFLWLAPMLGSTAGLPTALASALPAINMLAVVWVLPELLRSFCLKFISSNIHYYGNIGVGDVLRQTQVLTHPAFIPFQLFCFNFGSTHAIHHIWVPEPFYIRQLTARAAHQAMREEGVVFNDLGTFSRANRYDWDAEAAASAA